MLPGVDDLATQDFSFLEEEMSENMPAGEERKVEFLGGAAIDGAPVAYIVVLAAVIVALSFFPFSVILASGGSFPMSQGIFGLVGWILGPIAGAVAAGIGVLIGGFLAPHTAGVLVVSIITGMTGAFAAGSMVVGDKRKGWWLYVHLLLGRLPVFHWSRLVPERDRFMAGHRWIFPGLVCIAVICAAHSHFVCQVDQQRELGPSDCRLSVWYLDCLWYGSRRCLGNYLSHVQLARRSLDHAHPDYPL